jgi:hypothetical protein
MDITHLLEQVRQRGGRVGVFPVSEQAWFDIGEWAKYFRAVSHLNPAGHSVPPGQGPDAASQWFPND